jgi:general L-amino acid transport system substrate-binding protein
MPRLNGALGLAAMMWAVALFAAEPLSAGYSLCALREGPRGPCTCKDTDNPAGQFSVVDKMLCKGGTLPSKDAKRADKAAKSTEGAAAGVTAQSAESQSGVAGVAATSNTASLGRKLDEVRARGKLLCGVNTGLLGFASQSEAGDWAGLDADFCRAVAAAALGDAAKAEFVPVETNERFDALKSGKIDVLARNTTWTMGREVDLGVKFAGVLYYDGQGFMTSDDRGFVSAQQLAGSKICVEAGTTTEANMAFFFKSHDIDAQTLVFPARDEMLKAYAEGACDTYSADRSALFSDRASFSDPLKHAILPEVISKEPLGPAVLQGDVEWEEIVAWTLAGLINAEEVGLDKRIAGSTDPLSGEQQRLVDGAGVSGEKLRLGKTWLRDVVAAVGNYGEMYEGNVGKGSALGMERGLNALWKRGGIMIAPPMW